MAYHRKTVRGDYNHMMGGDGRSRPTSEKPGIGSQGEENALHAQGGEMIGAGYSSS